MTDYQSMTGEPKRCPICDAALPGCPDQERAVTEKQWGHYTVIRVGNHRWDEWTNIGIVIFGSDGKQAAARMDTLDRAIARGDCEASWLHFLPAPGSSDYLNSIPDVASVERRLETVAHAMSVIQITPLRATLVWHGALPSLWAAFIGGRRAP